MEWDEHFYKLHKMFQKLNDSVHYSCTNRREVTVISGLHVGYSYNLSRTLSYWMEKRHLYVFCVMCYYGLGFRNQLSSNLNMDWVLEIRYLPIYPRYM